MEIPHIRVMAVIQCHHMVLATIQPVVIIILNYRLVEVVVNAVVALKWETMLMESTIAVIYMIKVTRIQ